MPLPQRKPRKRLLRTKLEIRQVGVNPAIRGYVARFRGTSQLAIARDIAADIASFRKVEMPIKEAEKRWARRSAGSIIRSRKICVAAEPIPNGAPTIMGCIDYASAICASLRAIGLKALFVRHGNHSYVKFLYGGAWYKADPLEQHWQTVKKMGPPDFRMEEHSRRRGGFAEGASPAAIGLKNHPDFFRYSHGPGERKRAGG